MTIAHLSGLTAKFKNSCTRKVLLYSAVVSGELEMSVYLGPRTFVYRKLEGDHASTDWVAVIRRRIFKAGTRSTGSILVSYSRDGHG